MPRNKTLMRIFKDLTLVEYLDSGMPRILKAYSRQAYTFSSHFIRASFPISQDAQNLKRNASNGRPLAKSGVESNMALNIMSLLESTPLSKAEIAKAQGKPKPTRYLNDLMKKLLESGQVAYTLPDKPRSRLRKYCLTEKGRALMTKSNQGQ